MGITDRSVSEDVDPSIGRFRNLVATAIISNNPAKRTAPEAKGHEPPRKVRADAQ